MLFQDNDYCRKLLTAIHNITAHDDIGEKVIELVEAEVLNKVISALSCGKFDNSTVEKYRKMQKMFNQGKKPKISYVSGENIIHLECEDGTHMQVPYEHMKNAIK